MTVIAFTGKDGGKIGELLTSEDILLNVPAFRTARIQEVHILMIHALCDAIDYMLLGVNDATRIGCGRGRAGADVFLVGLRAGGRGRSGCCCHGGHGSAHHRVLYRRSDV